MLNLFFSSLGTGHSVLPPQEEPPAELGYTPVYLIAGQSNALGTNNGSIELPEYLKIVQPNVTYAQVSSGDYVGKVLDGTASLPKLGMEHSLGYELYKATKTPLMITKSAWGGSYLVGLSAGWHPDANNSLLHNTMTRIKRFMDNKAALGLNPKLVSLIWYQGESDAGQTAAAYKAALLYLFDSWRNHANNTYWLNGNNLNIQLVQLNNQVGNAAFEVIRTVQAEVAAEQAHTDLVDAGPFEIKGGHLTTLGQCGLGKAVFQSLVQRN